MELICHNDSFCTTGGHYLCHCHIARWYAVSQATSVHLNHNEPIAEITIPKPTFCIGTKLSLDKAEEVKWIPKRNKLCEWFLCKTTIAGIKKDVLNF
jgi:hypothetical protein